MTLVFVDGDCSRKFVPGRPRLLWKEAPISMFDTIPLPKFASPDILLLFLFPLLVPLMPLSRLLALVEFPYWFMIR